MSVEPDTVIGSLVVKNLTENACFESFEDLVRQLPDWFAVSIPANITNVTISNAQPADADKDNLWIRMSNSGVVIGFYVYSEGKWVQLTPVPKGIFRVYGDSRVVPAGYLLADADNPFLSTEQATAIVATWHRDPTDTFYDIFDVTQNIQA